MYTITENKHKKLKSLLVTLYTVQPWNIWGLFLQPRGPKPHV